MRGVRVSNTLVALGLVALLSSPSAIGGTSSHSSRVPEGFVGMMADGPVFDSQVNLDQQLGKMASSGVERVRVEFNWSIAQPYRTWADVPAAQRYLFTRGPGGSPPTNFSYTDQVVTAAADHEMFVLPVVLHAPSWDAVHRGHHLQPARDKPYGVYLTDLIKRYGPRGSFWRSNPSIPRWPITSWQVWNEPNLRYDWDTTPFAKSYVALLRAAHTAIKKADPSATVVLGSLVNYGWKALDTLYKFHGIRKLFDVVASNPYTLQPSGVIKILSYMRAAMDQHGDSHKPLIATEVGWPSAKGKTDQTFGFNTTEKGQAKKLAKLLPLLAADRRRLGLQSFYYYTWMSTDQRNAVSWAFSGLLRFSHGRVKAKPAYFTFKRVVLKLEGCKHKGSTPYSCS